ncbi:MAG: hypothetical protein ACFFAN_13310 [Promethearchaeota archaeon]
MNLEKLGFVSPREQPIVYPGKIADFSFMYEDGEFFKIKIKHDKPIDESEIKGRDNITISSYCMENGITPLGKRIGILSYGSNCNPAQLRNKFQGRELGDKNIFAIQCICSNVDTVWLADLAPYGAVPAGLAPSPGTKLEAFVLFLTEEQLKIMDETESRGTYYDLKELNEYCELANGEYLFPLYTYTPKKPMILDKKNQPIRLKALKAMGSKFKALNHMEMLNHIINNFLSAGERRGISLDIFNTPLNKNDERWRRIQGNISRRFSEVSKFEGIESNPNRIYSFFTLSPIQGTNLTMLGTSDRSMAKGNYICEINSNNLKRLDIKEGEYVQVLNEVFDIYVDKYRMMRTQVRCYRCDFLKDNQIRVDQSARNAIGLKKFNEILISKSRIKTPPIHRRIFNYRYVFCRVRRSEVNDMEKNICRIPKTTMEIIGVEDGDLIFVESEYGQVKLRAFEITVEDLEARHQLEKEFSDAPKEERAKLGYVFDADCTRYLQLTLEGLDIPPIWLDYEARLLLGVTLCDSVRIRRSVVSSLEREFTDLGWIVVASLIGILVAFPDLYVIIAVGSAVIFFSALLIVLKIRHKVK